MKKFRPFILIFSTICSVVISVSGANAFSSKISVGVNEAYIQRVANPISNVIIGDPSLLTISVIDQHRIVLNGIRSGKTNLIILDQNNDTQLNAMVNIPVQNKDGREVTLRRHVQGVVKNQSYMCESYNCVPSMNADSDPENNLKIKQYRSDINDLAMQNIPESSSGAENSFVDPYNNNGFPENSAPPQY